MGQVLIKCCLVCESEQGTHLQCSQHNGAEEGLPYRGNGCLSTETGSPACSGLISGPGPASCSGELGACLWAVAAGLQLSVCLPFPAPGVLLRVVPDGAGMYMQVETRTSSCLHLKRAPGIRSWSLLVGKGFHVPHKIKNNFEKG